MQEELRYIKKKFGERMMHLCRENFSTILETPKLLTKILLENFEPSKYLYDDLMNEGKIKEFVLYINSNLKTKDKVQNYKIDTPEKMLARAGYILFECKTETDIQKFKKFYQKEEQLCTFNGGRLNRCYVFFAVKNDADSIRREDFLTPKRQDKYGTSVISIQIDKVNNYVSIKNRYNHTVENPDCTFNNNLDNIIPGLIKSFENKLNICLNKNNLDKFEIPGYIKAIDGKYYKYNSEVDNIYYCPNNTIINRLVPKKYDKSKYILVDTFLIDLVKKKIEFLVKENCADLNEYLIKKINIISNGENKIINIDNNFIIEIDKYNRIINYVDKVSRNIEDYYFYHNKTLKKIILPNVKKIGNSFLNNNTLLNEIYLSNVEEIGDNFLYYNKNLHKIELPLIEKIGNDFISNNNILDTIISPKLKLVGNSFLNQSKIKEIQLLKLEKVGWNFLSDNSLLKEAYFPNLLSCGNGFLKHCKNLKILNISNLIYFLDDYLLDCTKLELLEIKNKIYNSFIYGNSAIRNRVIDKKERKAKKIEKKLVVVRK